VQRPFPGPVV